MPLELGLCLGCKRFGSEAQQKKACLILDSDPYRYRESLSDISGQDIHSHKGNPKRANSEVRDWLANVSKEKGLPGGAEIAVRYARFTKDLPEICKKLKRRPRDLTFMDFSERPGATCCATSRGHRVQRLLPSQLLATQHGLRFWA
jgi:hypothetical protein